MQLLWDHCYRQREQSTDRWHAPSVLSTRADNALALTLGNDGAFLMNDWSFSSLCRLAGVSKDNRILEILPPCCPDLFARVPSPRENDWPLPIQHDIIPGTSHDPARDAFGDSH